MARGDIIQRAYQSGLRQHPSIPRARVVEDHVRPGAGRERGLHGLAHLVGCERLAPDLDTGVRGHECSVDCICCCCVTGVRKLVPDL